MTARRFICRTCGRLHVAWAPRCAGCLSIGDLGVVTKLPAAQRAALALLAKRQCKTLPTILKMDANCCYVAVPDPASGIRGRYTMHRIYRWGAKHTDVIGREIPLDEAYRVAGVSRRKVA